MAIITSTYIEGTRLPDGSRFVTETHTDSEGVQYVRGWVGTGDAATVVAANAAALADELAAVEAAWLIDGD